VAIIVPSILENTQVAFLDTMSKELKLPGVERIQVDFGDGKFVPNTILPVSEITTLNPAYHWEAHLMIEHPTDFLDYQIAGFKTIIVHYEAYESVDALAAAVSDIKSFGLEPVICLKVETAVDELADFYPQVKHFQLMAIHPGFQGTPFLESTYGRIKQLREMFPDAIIEIDGGVNFENIKKISEVGADLIIAGSVITKAPDMLQAYEKLQQQLTIHN
jgi:ribulose-phosphate 3-epimerase